MDLVLLKKDFYNANIPARIPENSGEGAFYRNSGEGEPAATCQALKRHSTHLRETIHVGIAGEMNFNLVVAGEHKGIIFCAPDRNQHLLMEYVIEMLELHDTRQAFALAIKNRALAQISETKPDDFRFVSPHYETECMSALVQEENWLSSDQNYQRIRMLANAKKIIVLPLDFMNTEQCKVLSKLLSEQKIQVGSIYTSNALSFYLRKNGWLGDAIETPVVDHFSSNLALISGGTPPPLIIEAATARYAPGRDLDFNYARKIIFSSFEAHKDFCLALMRDSCSPPKKEI